ncbi:MAG: CaiB/BaiF CoA transferase family protein [Reyranellaceae bacterium]
MSSEGRASTTAAPPGPLQGLRVLELGQMWAGPFVGALLGDFGARVIKVEKPGTPDAIRSWQPQKQGQPLLWKSMSRNKLTITLDLSNPAAKPTVLKLIENSDIVIENFRPGTLERWGYAPATLSEKFPRIIWVRVSGYGQDGPNAMHGGYATAAEAFSGLASITGYQDRGPLLSSFPMGDYLAGTFGAFGALVAVNERHRSGRGQVVDVSLYEPILRILEATIVRADQLGTEKQRLGNQFEESAPRNVYQTKDGGYIAFSSGSDRLWLATLDTIDRPEVKQDSRFFTVAGRVAHRAEVDGMVADWMRSKTTDEALEALHRNGLVADKINTIFDVFKDEHVRHRKSLIQVEDPDLGVMTLPAPVPHLERTPGAVRWTGGGMGRDNDLVFREILNLSDGEIHQLSESRAI